MQQRKEANTEAKASKNEQNARSTKTKPTTIEEKVKSEAEAQDYSSKTKIESGHKT